MNHCTVAVNPCTGAGNDFTAVLYRNCTALVNDPWLWQQRSDSVEFFPGMHKLEISPEKVSFRLFVRVWVRVWVRVRVRVRVCKLALLRRIWCCCVPWPRLCGSDCSETELQRGIQLTLCIPKICVNWMLLKGSITIKVLECQILLDQTQHLLINKL